MRRERKGNAKRKQQENFNVYKKIILLILFSPSIINRFLDARFRPHFYDGGGATFHKKRLNSLEMLLTVDGIVRTNSA